MSESQAGSDLGWLGKGTCGTSGTTITCVSTEAPCPSNTNNECLTVTVNYDYSASPLFPELPGMGVVTPSTISAEQHPADVDPELVGGTHMDLRRPCRRVRDERGATLVLVAISMIMLLWGGAFAVDLGLTTVGNRQVQNHGRHRLTGRRPVPERRRLE